MVDFNWENCKAHASPQRYNWFEQNHDQPITEEQYLETAQMFKKFSKGKPKYYSPNRTKKTYHYFKKTFGFFPDKRESL